MKAIKRIFYFILTVSLLLFCGWGILRIYRIVIPKVADIVPAESSVSAPTADIAADPMSAFSRLTEDEQEVYTLLCEHLDNYEDTASIGRYHLQEAGIKRVWAALVQDNPQYFWFESYTYHYNESSGDISDMTIAFFYEEAEIRSRQALLKNWCDGIKSGMPAGLGEYDKAKYFHDAIIKQVDYDINVPDDQNLCSVFMSGKTVCAGYSKAFQYLLKDSGIFAAYIIGEVTDRGPHAWNLVKMDGEYYYVDVTWDDPNFSGEDVAPSGLEYTYFGMTTAEISQNHRFDTTLGTLPEFTATADNYFVREKRLFDFNVAGESARFSELLYQTAAVKPTSLSVKFTDAAMVSQALEIIEYGDILSYASIQYIKDSYYPVLTLIFQ